MGDDLTISGGGSMAVGTDELFATADDLTRLARELSASARHLLAIEALGPRRNPGRSVADVGSPEWAQVTDAVARAERHTGNAGELLQRSHRQAEVLGAALRLSAEGYGFVEHSATRAWQESTGNYAAFLGRFAPGLLVGQLAGTAASIFVAGIAENLVGDVIAGRLPDMTAALGGAPREWLNNPLTTELLRTIADASGDAAVGGWGLPFGGVPEALGSTGVAVGASAVIGLASKFGIFQETDVRQTGSLSQPVTRAPRGFAERFRRIPDTGDTEGAQVIIETYSTEGEPDRFEVYVTGTVTFSPIAVGEPMDMTSNMVNAVEPGSGAYDAVAKAMVAAGIDENSPVQFTGYSQGAGTAAQLAASGQYNTQGLATFGGPTGSVPIPSGFPAVIIQHTDDLVPALGGHQLNNDAIVIERTVAEPGESLPQTDDLFPVHHRPSYAHTADLVDRAESSQVRSAAAQLDAFGGTAASVTSTAYRFERFEPASVGD